MLPCKVAHVLAVSFNSIHLASGANLSAPHASLFCMKSCVRNDDNALEFNKLGGVGAIGVTANIAAKLSSDFQAACVKDINKASELNKILQPLHEAMFIESNPSPVKYAASLLSMCDASVRLPLVEVQDKNKKKISEALKVAKIL